MSYIPAAKVYLKCEAVPLLNEVDGGTMTATGTPTLTGGYAGRGLQLSPSYHLDTTTSLGISTAFSIGFWLQGVYPGMATDGSAMVPLKMPLFSKCVFSSSTSGGVTTFTASNTQFIVHEETGTVNGQNSLVVTVGTAKFTTAPYEVSSSFQHFAVVYDGSAQTITVYLNGAALTGTLTGTVPTTVGGAGASSFGVNENAEGHSYELAQHTGVLDEVVITNSTLSASDVFRLYSLGVPYVIDTVYNVVDEATLAFSFTDPSSLQMNAAASRASDVFIAVNDGTLFRGRRKFWDCQRSFGSPAEQASLMKGYGAQSDSTYRVTDGILAVSGVVIRL